jgi:P-type Cu+ transporter
MAMATDPVCGMQVETESAKYTFDHAGQTWYFCSKGCMLDFSEQPARYTHPDWVPQPMEDMEQGR